MSNHDWVHVFVYGTLKRGGRLNAAFNKKLSEYVGTGELDNGLTLYVPTKGSRCWFPMLLEEETRIKCQGELYLVDPMVLKQLDIIEGVPDLYVRKEVEVSTTGGSKVKAYTYIYNNTLPNGMEIKPFFKVG